MGLTLAIWVDDVIAAHGCGLRLKMSRNSATVYGFMILCSHWYRKNIGIIKFRMNKITKLFTKHDLSIITLAKSIYQITILIVSPFT